MTSIVNREDAIIRDTCNGPVCELTAEGQAQLIAYNLESVRSQPRVSKYQLKQLQVNVGARARHPRKR